MYLTDNWIVGFVDGDGCFKIVQSKTKRYCFVVSQNKRSIDVLYALKTKFACGNVNKAGQDMFEYRVTKKEHLINIIFPFFLKNPLRTQKIKDFEHVYEGLMGAKPIFNNTKYICQDWLVGFIDAEANFYVSMVRDYPRPQFSIGLHLRDEEVLNLIKNFMSCGTVYHKKSKKGEYATYQISALSDCLLIIKMCTTSTNRCLLKTTKRISFLRFKQIIHIIHQGKHCTIEGINRIQKIRGSIR
jgi:LAGLIDADG endonuclease